MPFSQQRCSTCQLSVRQSHSTQRRVPSTGLPPPPPPPAQTTQSIRVHWCLCQAHCSFPGWGWMWRGVLPGEVVSGLDEWAKSVQPQPPATAPCQDTPTGMPEVAQAAGRLFWVKQLGWARTAPVCAFTGRNITDVQSLHSIPDLPPALLITTVHLAPLLGQETATLPGDFAHTALTPERSVVYPKLC